MMKRPKAERSRRACAGRRPWSVMPILSRMSLLSVLCCLTVSSLACGRKAPPRPPQDVLPKPIADLSASNTAQGIQLSWSRPRLYADGSAMPDLGGFVIERATGTDPLAPFQRLAVLEVT